MVDIGIRQKLAVLIKTHLPTSCPNSLKILARLTLTRSVPRPKDISSIVKRILIANPKILPAL